MAPRNVNQGVGSRATSSAAIRKRRYWSTRSRVGLGCPHGPEHEPLVRVLPDDALEPVEDGLSERLKVERLAREEGRGKVRVSDVPADEDESRSLVAGLDEVLPPIDRDPALEIVDV